MGKANNYCAYFGNDQLLFEGLKAENKQAETCLYLSNYKMFESYIKKDYNISWDNEDSLDLIKNAFIEGTYYFLEEVRHGRWVLQSTKISTALVTYAETRWKGYESRKLYKQRNIFSIDASTEEKQTVEQIDREQSEIVAKSLDAISTDCKQLLTLKYVEELSYEEIAKIMNKSEGYLRKAMAERCREYFKKELMKWN